MSRTKLSVNAEGVGDSIEREILEFLNNFGQLSKDFPPALVFPSGLGRVAMRNIRYQAAMYNLLGVYIGEGDNRLVAVFRRAHLQGYFERNFEKYFVYNEDKEPIDVGHLDLYTTSAVSSQMRRKVRQQMRLPPRVNYPLNTQAEEVQRQLYRIAQRDKPRRVSGILVPSAEIEPEIDILEHEPREDNEATELPPLLTPYEIEFGKYMYDVKTASQLYDLSNSKSIDDRITGVTPEVDESKDLHGDFNRLPYKGAQYTQYDDEQTVYDEQGFPARKPSLNLNEQIQKVYACSSTNLASTSSSDKANSQKFVISLSETDSEVDSENGAVAHSDTNQKQKGLSEITVDDLLCNKFDKYCNITKNTAVNDNDSESSGHGAVKKCKLNTNVKGLQDGPYDKWHELFDLKMEHVNEIMMYLSKNVLIVYANQNYRPFQNRLYKNLEHVVEVHNFPVSFQTQNILNIFREEPRYVKWVDDNHALLVTANAEQAERFLKKGHRMIQTRAMTSASAVAVVVACRCDLRPAVSRKSRMLSKRSDVPKLNLVQSLAVSKVEGMTANPHNITYIVRNFESHNYGKDQKQVITAVQQTYGEYLQQIAILVNFIVNYCKNHSLPKDQFEYEVQVRGLADLIDDYANEQNVYRVGEYFKYQIHSLANLVVEFSNLQYIVHVDSQSEHLSRCITNAFGNFTSNALMPDLQKQLLRRDAGMGNMIGLLMEFAKTYTIMMSFMNSNGATNTEEQLEQHYLSIKALITNIIQNPILFQLQQEFKQRNVAIAHSLGFLACYIQDCLLILELRREHDNTADAANNQNVEPAQSQIEQHDCGQMNEVTDYADTVKIRQEFQELVHSRAGIDSAFAKTVNENHEPQAENKAENTEELTPAFDISKFQNWADIPIEPTTNDVQPIVAPQEELVNLQHGNNVDNYNTNENYYSTDETYNTDHTNYVQNYENDVTQTEYAHPETVYHTGYQYATPVQQQNISVGEYNVPQQVYDQTNIQSYNNQQSYPGPYVYYQPQAPSPYEQGVTGFIVYNQGMQHQGQIQVQQPFPGCPGGMYYQGQVLQQQAPQGCPGGMQYQGQILPQQTPQGCPGGMQYQGQVLPQQPLQGCPSGMQYQGQILPQQPLQGCPGGMPYQGQVLPQQPPQAVPIYVQTPVYQANYYVEDSSRQ